MNIQIRTGTKADLKEIMNIITEARHKLAASGSPQWADEDTPTEDRILEDIRTSGNYVFIINGTLIGTAAMINEEEDAYASIEYGEWANENPNYSVIHRFAIDPVENGKGYAKLFMKLLIFAATEKGITELRIDTHPKNRAMQKIITSNKFTFTGIIHLPIPDGERYAYQLFLPNT